jgi:hypothetical protein
MNQLQRTSGHSEWPGTWLPDCLLIKAGTLLNSCTSSRDARGVAEALGELMLDLRLDRRLTVPAVPHACCGRLRRYHGKHFFACRTRHNLVMWTGFSSSDWPKSANWEAYHGSDLVYYCLVGVVDPRDRFVIGLQSHCSAESVVRVGVYGLDRRAGSGHEDSIHIALDAAVLSRSVPGVVNVYGYDR